MLADSLFVVEIVAFVVLLAIFFAEAVVFVV